MDRRRFLRSGLSVAAGLAAVACSQAASTPPGVTPSADLGAAPGLSATPAARGDVPPGTVLHNENVPRFYVRFIRSFPALDPGRWQLELKGLLDAPTTMTLEHIRRNLPLVEQSTRMKCVEGWSSRAQWGGFPFDALAAIVRPQATATHVRFECEDDYYEVVPISELRRERALFVTHMDGQPIGAKYGAPLRMILPWLYGYKGAKTINSLEFLARGGKGYWSTVGPYTVDGLILPGSDVPLDLDGKARSGKGGEVTDY